MTLQEIEYIYNIKRPTLSQNLYLRQKLDLANKDRKYFISCLDLQNQARYNRLQSRKLALNVERKTADKAHVVSVTQTKGVLFFIIQNDDGIFCSYISSELSPEEAYEKYPKLPVKFSYHGERLSDHDTVFLGWDYGGLDNRHMTEDEVITQSHRVLEMML